MRRIANIRAISLEDAWSLYFVLPNEGDTREFVEVISEAHSISRKTARATLNSLILLGIVRRDQGKLKKIEIADRSELRRIARESLGIEREKIPEWLICESLGVTGSKTAISTFLSLLKKTGILVPTRVYCAADDGVRLLEVLLQSLNGKAEVRNLRRRSLESGMSDSEFRKALLEALREDRILLEGRRRLLDIWRDLGAEDLPFSIDLKTALRKLEVTRDYVEEIVNENRGLIGIMTQRGREILNFMEIWDENDVLRVVCNEGCC